MISKSRLALSVSGREAASIFLKSLLEKTVPGVLAASRASLGMVLPARHPPPPSLPPLRGRRQRTCQVLCADRERAYCRVEAYSRPPAAGAFHTPNAMFCVRRLLLPCPAISVGSVPHHSPQSLFSASTSPRSISIPLRRRAHTKVAGSVKTKNLGQQSSKVALAHVQQDKISMWPR